MKPLDTYFNEFVDDRNLLSRSKREYNIIIKSYTEFNKIGLDKLLNKADHEEEEGIRLKRRKIKSKLKNYRNNMLNEKKYSINTIKLYFTKIKTICNHLRLKYHTFSQ